MTDEKPHGPSEMTFAEVFHPARPRSLRYRARLRQPVARRSVGQSGDAAGTNPAYVAWLLSQSMLEDANTIGRQFSGQGSMWQNPFASPDPRHAVETASVWFTAYPISLITRRGETFLGSLTDEALWDAFEEIGIDGVHTGPVKRAGGLAGWAQTPSVDGHFDRISMEIDPEFGTEAEFRAMCGMATWHGGTIIDDVVPGHTGKGADFRLAEMKHADYPGIYHMVEIDPEDWECLPEVPPGRDSVNVDSGVEATLEKRGYIIGRLQRVIFYAEGVKETNWSATRPVVGVDGVARRWVYLHYFKEGQPTINWLDPSFAGMRLVIGDVLHSLADLGSGALRLDANGFLGAEKTLEGDSAWSEGHPLSEAANHFIASIVRKVGGFTFQELNLTVDDIKITSEAGADLSYDFVNRPAYHHALLTHDTEFLRLTLRTALDVGVDPASLVHALQNHDELTYELLHWTTGHSNDTFSYHGQEISGSELADLVRADLCRHLTGGAAPYNLVFTTNGIACTTASVVTAALGITDLAAIGPDELERIRRAHLLLAMFNALQPGVFALSGWDLRGVLPLPPARVADLLASGDTRWINRGAHDLMGANPGATTSAAGIPRGTSVYGSLPEQLADGSSFARRLQRILAVRRRHGINVSRQVDVPDVSHRAMLVMVHALDEPGQHQLTVLNFADEPISGTVRSTHLTPGASVTDMLTERPAGTVDDLQSFPLELDAHEGVSLLVTAPQAPDDPAR
jgi:trehalose synthase